MPSEIFRDINKIMDSDLISVTADLAGGSVKFACISDSGKTEAAFTLGETIPPIIRKGNLLKIAYENRWEREIENKPTTLRYYDEFAAAAKIAMEVKLYMDEKYGLKIAYGIDHGRLDYALRPKFINNDENDFLWLDWNGHQKKASERG